MHWETHQISLELSHLHCPVWLSTLLCHDDQLHDIRVWLVQVAARETADLLPEINVHGIHGQCCSQVPVLEGPRVNTLGTATILDVNTPRLGIFHPLGRALEGALSSKGAMCHVGGGGWSWLARRAQAFENLPT